MPLLNESVVLTSLSQVMQVFPEPALETFEIPNEKIQGYILHESDIVRGLINYHYYLAQQNDVAMSFQTYGTDAMGLIDFVWNPDSVGHADLRIPMYEGVDYWLDWTTRIMSLTPAFMLKTVNAWNALTMPSTPALKITDILVPIEFTVMVEC